MKPRSSASEAGEAGTARPRSGDDVRERESEAAGAPRPAVERHRSALRALVVDDDRLARAMVVDILRADGMVCQDAADGAEALAACEAARPDLILLDIVMPGVDGVETCRRLKANPDWSSIPVIALTSREDPQTVIDMLDAGAFLYLVKPVAPEQLLNVARLALAPRLAAP